MHSLAQGFKVNFQQFLSKSASSAIERPCLANETSLLLTEHVGLSFWHDEDDFERFLTIHLSSVRVSVGCLAEIS
jgi:hypothetical protein